MEIERDLDSEFFTDSPALFLPTHTKLRRGYSGRLASRTINAIVKKLLSKVNEDLSKTNESIDPADFHPHAFRHTHAYKLIAKSDIAQVQKRLGHKRPDLVVLYAQMPESEEIDLINEVEQT
ncbi:site-specific integrase [bacterium]|nr:site-specific integrase [candidate division CSSED10-310 bacterium]